MAFTDQQQKQLSGKLAEKHICTRVQHGMKLSYMEGWHAIDEANRIFGFDGWDRETVWVNCVWEDGRREPKACAYAVRIRIRVRAGDTIICREGSGVGHGKGATLGEAHESALKEAETDATKRALTTFGNPFGLALYDKHQAGVRRNSKPKVMPNGIPIDWVFTTAKGEILGRYDVPQGFCGQMREALNKASDLAELHSLWTRNAETVEQLRIVSPDLKTAQGTHYADILENLRGQRMLQLQSLAEREKAREVESAPVDKSELTLATAKRLRDGTHLRFVASLPCLVCGRTPSQAHHLRFAQLRSMGSKVSDEWTVPLCITHHRSLHDVGIEEDWWREQEIDAKTEATKLWQQHRQPELSSETKDASSASASATGTAA